MTVRAGGWLAFSFRGLGAAGAALLCLGASACGGDDPPMNGAPGDGTAMIAPPVTGAGTAGTAGGMFGNAGTSTAPTISGMAGAAGATG